MENEGRHRENLNRLAFQATLHCLTGCAIGEVSGFLIGWFLGWGVGATIALSIILAFIASYIFTMYPLLRSGMPISSALAIALGTDTVSVVSMEAVDNAAMLLIPGAVHSGPGDFLFWGSLTLALTAAFFVTLPVNQWLIRRGWGHSGMPHH